MNRKKVSIIMPAYNAEKYISKCIESIINQSIKEWELIIIDDGSTDSTGQICEGYKKNDTRIQVFHQKNSGVSIARNKGIENAGGTYIAFVDSDDILTPDSLKNRIQLIKDSDMAIAAYEIIDQHEKNIKRMPECKKYFWNRNQGLHNVIIGEEIGYQGYLWNKLFVRKIIMDNELKFLPGIAYNEDRLFIVEYLLCSKKIHLNDEIVYVYRQNEDGAMGYLNKMKDNDYDKIVSEFIAYQKMCDKLKIYDNDLYHLCATDAQRRAYELYRNVPSTEKKLKRGFRYYIRKFGSQAFYFGQGSLSFKKKIKILAHTILGR